jgi:hypothetical protein
VLQLLKLKLAVVLQLLLMASIGSADGQPSRA